MNPLTLSRSPVDIEQTSITVLCCKNEHKLGDSQYSELLQKLPDEMRSRIVNTKSIEKAQSSLISKLLLREGFEKYLRLDDSSLSNIEFTRYDRPYFINHSIDFNISHSHDLVVCAISPGNQVGVDLEKIRPVNIGHFLKEFSGQELMNIHNAEDQSTAFFSYWTKKEAILKAEGLGINQSLSEIKFNQSGTEAEIFSRHWFLYPIPIHKDYCCWLASSEPVDPDNVQIAYKNII